MGEGTEIRVVLINCELVCSLCKVSSVVHKAVWKLCVLSEGNIWESIKWLIVQDFRKPLLPCQLKCKAPCSCEGSLVVMDRFWRSPCIALTCCKRLQTETLKLRCYGTCSMALIQQCTCGCVRTLSTWKVLLVSPGNVCAQITHAGVLCWIRPDVTTKWHPLQEALNCSGVCRLPAEGRSRRRWRCQTCWPLDMPPFPAFAEGCVSLHNDLFIL